MKNPAQNIDDYAGAPRRWFARLLWRAFPGPSERDVARRAARVLGVSERQVINWLGEHHGASLDHVAKVLLVAGAEIVIRGGGR